jgi:hypothetical protein
LFALDAVNGIAGRNLGIVTIVVSLVAAAGGFGWLGYLTIGGVAKWRKEGEVSREEIEE